MYLGRLRFFLTVSAILTLLASVLLPLNSSAQLSASIIVDVSPQNPGPNESVTITLSSYANNLDSVQISWSVGGKVVLTGIGKKSYTLTAPGAGSQTSVIATAYLPDGAAATTIVIRPTQTVLLWQALDSYTPPFYRGKALPTPDSKVKVVAMPEIKIGGSMAVAKNLVYSWKKDYTNAPDDSGFAKSSFTYINDYLDNSNNISVTASTTDGQYSTSANIDIGTANPKILFYKNDPVLGTLWGTALRDGYRVSGNEVIQAAPYFISPKNINTPTLTWDWAINDLFVAVPGFRKDLFPISAQAGTSGMSKISLEVNNTDKIFETVNGEINVQF